MTSNKITKIYKFFTVFTIFSVFIPYFAHSNSFDGFSVGVAGGFGRYDGLLSDNKYRLAVTADYKAKNWIVGFAPVFAFSSADSDVTDTLNNKSKYQSYYLLSASYVLNENLNIGLVSGYGIVKAEDVRLEDHGFIAGGKIGFESAVTQTISITASLIGYWMISGAEHDDWISLVGVKWTL